RIYAHIRLLKQVQGNCLLCYRIRIGLIFAIRKIYWRPGRTYQPESDLWKEHLHEWLIGIGPIGRMCGKRLHDKHVSSDVKSTHSCRKLIRLNWSTRYPDERSRKTIYQR